MKKIIVDTLLSDLGEEEVVKGAILASFNHPEIQFKLVGDKANIEKILNDNNQDLDLYEIVDAKPCDTLSPNPIEYLNGHDDISMLKALNLLSKDEEAIGLLSSGPTGLLLVGSMFKLGLIRNVKFPSLAALLININQRKVCIVDCGANLDVKPTRLVQFAKQGCALISSYYGNISPRVGLLNVGKEEGKGNATLKETFELLSQSNLNFKGNIEGSDAFLDKVDVVVCDGYVGNVLLKNSEAVAMICKAINEKSGSEEKAIKEANETIYNMFGYNELGGAIVLGTNKLVMKAHGACNKKSIASIVDDLVKLDENNLISKMKETLGEEK